MSIGVPGLPIGLLRSNAPQQLADPSFDAGITGWVIGSGEGATTTAVWTGAGDKRLQLTNISAGGTYVHAYYTLTGLTLGRSYRFSAVTDTAVVSYQLGAYTTVPGVTPAANTLMENVVTASGAAQTLSGSFLATAATMYVVLGGFHAAAASSFWSEASVR